MPPVPRVEPVSSSVSPTGRGLTALLRLARPAAKVDIAPADSSLTDWPDGSAAPVLCRTLTPQKGQG